MTHSSEPLGQFRHALLLLGEALHELGTHLTDIAVEEAAEVLGGLPRVAESLNQPLVAAAVTDALASFGKGDYALAAEQIRFAARVIRWDKPVPAPEASNRDDSLVLIADLDAVPSWLVAEFMGALDGLHRSFGGGGLSIGSVETGADAVAGAPA